MTTSFSREVASQRIRTWTLPGNGNSPPGVGGAGVGAPRSSAASGALGKEVSGEARWRRYDYFRSFAFCASYSALVSTFWS
jgi:hypothetical protein